MSYVLGAGSLRRLKGVKPELVAIVERAIEITTQDFSVTEGLRSIETQRQYYEKGASKTLKSRHLTGHAVDLVPYHGKGISPWPSHYPYLERDKYLEAFNEVARAMFEAADELEILLQWGSDWDLDGIPTPMDPDENFMDMPHWQLPYPTRYIDARNAMTRRCRLRQLGEEVIS